MAVIIGRSGWQALPPNWPIGEIQRVDDYVVHHSVTAQPRSVDESIGQVQSIQRDHLKREDAHGNLVFGDIAYNVVAGWNCAVVGRGPTRLDGATDTDPLTNTWSVCVLGDYTKDLVTPEIRAGIIEALLLGWQLYGRHPIRPHFDFYPTSCCGGYLAAELPVIYRAVEIVWGQSGSSEPVTDAEIDKLAKRIVTEFMGHPLNLLNDDLVSEGQYSTGEALQWIHAELKRIRYKITA